MDIVFKTKRLYARRFVLSDDQQFYSLNNDPEVLKYTGDQPFESIGEARNFIKKYDHYDKHGFGRWAILSRHDDTFLGWCGLKQNEEDLVDIGFRFFRSHWGKGYATESAAATIVTGFTTFSINEIVGRAARANPASIRVLEKIGMTYWKVAPCQGIEDAVYYRIKRTIDYA